MKLGVQGQSVVEYIMLLAVVVTFGTTLMNSKLVKEMLGPNSGFFTILKNYTESTYQYGYLTTSKRHDYSKTAIHDTYYNTSISATRFWTAIDADK